MCEWCGRPKRLGRLEQSIAEILSQSQSGNMQVHHLTYDRLGCENFSDLIVVCDECHDYLHKFISKMAGKGFTRWDVMRKLAPYCIRRLLKIHDLYRTDYFVPEQGSLT